MEKVFSLEVLAPGEESGSGVRFWEGIPVEIWKKQKNYSFKRRIAYVKVRSSMSKAQKIRQDLLGMLLALLY